MSDVELLCRHCNLLQLALRCLPREDPRYVELEREYEETRRALQEVL